MTSTSMHVHVVWFSNVPLVTFDLLHHCTLKSVQIKEEKGNTLLNDDISKLNIIQETEHRTLPLELQCTHT